MNEETQEMEDLPPTKKPKIEICDDEPTYEDFTQDMSFVHDNKDFKLNIAEYGGAPGADGEHGATGEDRAAGEDDEQLREYKVLDEVQAAEDDSAGSDTSDDEKSEEVPEDEIEKMLDEDLPDGFKGAPKPKEKPYVTGQKIVLEDNGSSQLEVLPLDWMMVRHYSGMPVYMHRATRVCTLSKPYFLGKGNIRRHDIPISAIPCFAYRKYLEEEEKQKEIEDKIEEQIRNGTWNIDQLQQGESAGEAAGQGAAGEGAAGAGEAAPAAGEEADTAGASAAAAGSAAGGSGVCPRRPVVLPGGQVMPPPRVQSLSSSWKTQHLTHQQLNDYCKKLFKFKTVNIMLFKRWADRHKYTKARKPLQYPRLPEGTKLIAIPANNHDNQAGGKGAKRDWVMNMDGRSYLAVFHEYVGRALQKQPIYEFKQLENAATPYQATVYIGGMQYGVGRGSSKRQAKSAAARASIHILIPEMRDELDGTRRHSDPDFTFFDYITIEDPRVAEFCAATCEPSPHAILRTCLLRNFGVGDRHVHTEMKKFENQKVELTMKVGKHTATVVCKNKKSAKQRASQAILQALHPHVRSWGSLLRLYGSQSVKSCKEKKLEEQQITLLQDKARHNEPNYAVLDKLRAEMQALRARDAAVCPVGTLLLAPPDPARAALNNVDL